MEKTSQIEDYLYLGGWWSATRTKAYGIKVILSILDSPIPDECRKDGIEYLSVIADDDESVDLLTHFPQTNQWISQCVESKRPILVHCMAGMSRSPTIVCAYVMQKYKKSTKEAIEWVRKKRSIIDPNEGFETQLELYHQMGYTLDAKNRNFRNFLFMSYLGTHNQSHSVRKYLELMTIARDLTGDVPLGRQYSCVKCSTPAFHEINIIRNDRLFVEHDCDDMYIEPMEWMLEEIEGMAPDKKEGTTTHRQCMTKVHIGLRVSMIFGSSMSCASET